MKRLLVLLLALPLLWCSAPEGKMGAITVSAESQKSGYVEDDKGVYEWKAHETADVVYQAKAELRRGVLTFDVAAQLPEAATVTSIFLRLTGCTSTGSSPAWQFQASGIAYAPGNPTQMWTSVRDEVTIPGNGSAPTSVYVDLTAIKDDILAKQDEACIRIVDDSEGTEDHAWLPVVANAELVCYFFEPRVGILQSDRASTVTRQSDRARTLDLASDRASAVDLPSERTATVDCASDRAGTLTLESDRAGMVSLASDRAGTLDRASDRAGTIDAPSDRATTVDAASDRATTVDLVSDRAGTLNIASDALPEED